MESKWKDTEAGKACAVLCEAKNQMAADTDVQRIGQDACAYALINVERRLCRDWDAKERLDGEINELLREIVALKVELEAMPAQPRGRRIKKIWCRGCEEWVSKEETRVTGSDPEVLKCAVCGLQLAVMDPGPLAPLAETEPEPAVGPWQTGSLPEGKRGNEAVVWKGKLSAYPKSRTVYHCGTYWRYQNNCSMVRASNYTHWQCVEGPGS